jgi:hypothetical protein
MPLTLYLPWKEFVGVEIDVGVGVHPEPEPPLREISALIFFEPLLVRDPQPYLSAARFRDKKHLASTPSNPLAFSHSFDAEWLAAVPVTVTAVVVTAAAPGGGASGDRIQGPRDGSIVRLVPLSRYVTLRYVHQSTVNELRKLRRSPKVVRVSATGSIEYFKMCESIL